MDSEGERCLELNYYCSMMEGHGSRWAFIFDTNSENEKSLKGAGRTILRNSRNVNGPQLLNNTVRF